MERPIKAYVNDEWERNALTIQVREGEGRGARLGVMEHLPGREDRAPLLRMVPVSDLTDDDGARAPQAPHPGFAIHPDVAEAILVALYAWSSSTPGDNPVERAQRAEGERDLALAEVAQLRHDLAVAEEQRTTWEVLALQKDDTILAHRDNLSDVRRAWDYAASPPIMLTGELRSTDGRDA